MAHSAVSEEVDSGALSQSIVETDKGLVAVVVSEFKNFYVSKSTPAVAAFLKKC